MKIKKKNTTIPINGKIVDTENVEDKTSNAPSFRLVEEMIKDIYSTEEQRIGTWIDGKPLYRKVIETTMAEAPSNGTYTNKIISDIPNINFGYVPKAIIIANNQHYVLPYINNAGYATKCFIDLISAHNLVLTNGNVTFNNCKIFVVLEYTKTTD